MLSEGGVVSTAVLQAVAVACPSLSLKLSCTAEILFMLQVVAAVSGPSESPRAKDSLYSKQIIS